jgi:hypothetical protein
VQGLRRRLHKKQEVVWVETETVLLGETGPRGMRLGMKFMADV